MTFSEIKDSHDRPKNPADEDEVRRQQWGFCIGDKVKLKDEFIHFTNELYVTCFVQRVFEVQTINLIEVTPIGCEKGILLPPDNLELVEKRK